MLISNENKLISFVSVLFFLVGCNSVNKKHVNWIEPNTKMEFVLIESGRFMMGTPPDESGEFKSDYFHEVELTGDYYIGRYEVTQHQWEIIMGYNPSNFVDFGDSLPVENISWYEANEFIHKLDSINPGYRFSLPTEAQWEYACRAGTTTPYNTGENLTTEQANYCGEFPYKNYPKGICREHPSVVGSFEPNDWGLFDMHGNVWEWCSDWFCEYPKTFVTDPLGNCDSELKVIRGGSWYFNAESARSARRYTHHPEDRGFSLGFRVVMTNDNCQSK